MTVTRSIRVLSWCVLVAGLTFLGQAALGQEPSSTKQPAAPTTVQPATATTAEAPAETPAPEELAPKKKTFRGRLPNYYSKVVDDKQRQQIYDVQLQYVSKIDALKAQLDAMIEERDKKVVAVLTPEQLQEVERLTAEAKAKRETVKKTAASSE